LNVTDAAGGQTVFTYNAIGELTTRTDQLNRLLSFTYDQRGWRKEITEDARLDPSAPDRRTTTFGYDLAGNVTSVTNGRGLVTAYGYNPVNRVESVTEASSFPVTLPPLNHGAPTTNYYYDLNGNVWWMTLPNGAITSYAYDPRD